MSRVRVYIYDESWAGPGFRAVMGYRGFGIVGLITTLHMVKSLSMERVGLILTKYHPEYAVMEEGGLAYPFEIYVSREKKLLVIVSRELPHELVRTEYARRVARFVSEIGASPLILVGGLDSRLRRDPGDQLRWVANRFYQGKTLMDRVFDRDLMIVGPLALQLLMSEAYRIPTVALLPYAATDAPDPAAAAVAVDRINYLLELDIATDELMEEATKIQEELMRLHNILKTEEERERKSRGGLYV